MATLEQTHPPAFLKLLAHQLRWQLLSALAESDRRVQELVDQLNKPQNLVSYHLRQLRAKQIVSERRSSADGRDVYYSLDIERVRALYLASGEALHPALGTTLSENIERKGELTSPSVRVLFLCTHNSARSQMAEAILRVRGRARVEAFSAGSAPGEIHPYAVKAMRELNINISQQRSKHMDELAGQAFDYIITVCDRVREACPVFPGDPKQIHWSFPDPAAVQGSRETQYKAFRQTAQELMTRINYLLLMMARRQQEKG
jgi:protein-tyrosine-phosphatase/DNA-binding transcriptional ArsR family regulator